MRFLKRIFVAILFIFFLLLGFWVAQENSAPVAIKLFGFPIQQVSLGLCLLAMFFSGVLLGLLAGTPSILRIARKNRQMQRTLQASQLQLQELKRQSHSS